MEKVIERMNALVYELGVTANAFAVQTGIGSSNMSRKLKGKVPFTSKDFVKISEKYGISREWLETGEGDMYPRPLDKAGCGAIKEGIKEISNLAIGTPFYDIDFALGFNDMYNDEPNVPSRYISVPGYEKADFWCRTSGDSMKPFISNGDIIALKEIQDWQSFLPMNEVYAIMTANGLRTVKVVRRGHDDTHISLHAYNGEYDDQEISKEVVMKVYKVLGVIKSL
jgi:phage repressor protein C with HTH and peptisase S24 domain